MLGRRYRRASSGAGGGGGGSSSSGGSGGSVKNTKSAAASGRSLTTSTRQSSSQQDKLIDLVDLEDFNVQLARLDDPENRDVLLYELTDVITEWMNGSYERHLRELGYSSSTHADVYADFDTVILLERRSRNRVLLRSQQQRRQQTGAGPPHSSPGHRRLQKQKEEQQGDSGAVASWPASSLDGSGSNGNGDATATKGQLYTAEFKGAALFTRNSTQLQVPPDVVQWIQASTLSNKTGLLQLLQASTASAGLGYLVVDVNPFAVSSTSSSSQQTAGGGGGDGDNLEIVIIVAVAVAAVAFIFLVVAVFWAWRYDRRNREAYLVGGSKRTRGGPHPPNLPGDPTANASNSTLDEEDHHHPDGGGGGGGRRPSSVHGSPGKPVSEIGGDSVVGGAGIYPESVISEDISTSLSQYYRSGLAGGGSSGVSSSAFADRRRGMADHLNDAASVSSMESYGYSLDGYAPSSVMANAASMPLTDMVSPRGLDDTDDFDISDERINDDDGGAASADDLQDDDDDADAADKKLHQRHEEYLEEKF